ncbi:MAG: hypothetical protein MZV63_21910 [Marinilabiliales bacterium]|nr:hypothetical protein [Marinilabiliales bacterium]
MFTRNTGIDLVRKGIITNIPDIKNKYIPGLKGDLRCHHLGQPRPAVRKLWHRSD